MTTLAEMLEMLRGGPIKPREIELSDEAFDREHELLEQKTEEFLMRLRAEKRR